MWDGLQDSEEWGWWANKKRRGLGERRKGGQTRKANRFEVSDWVMLGGKWVRELRSGKEDLADVVLTSYIQHVRKYSGMWLRCLCFKKPTDCVKAQCRENLIDNLVAARNLHWVKPEDIKCAGKPLWGTLWNWAAGSIDIECWSALKRLGSPGTKMSAIIVWARVLWREYLCRPLLSTINWLIMDGWIDWLIDQRRHAQLKTRFSTQGLSIPA